MLTDYFSCYKRNNKSTPSMKWEIHKYLTIVKFPMILKFWSIQIFQIEKKTRHDLVASNEEVFLPIHP